MTVKDLIDKLSRLDPDSPVYLEVEEYIQLSVSVFVDGEGDTIISTLAHIEDVEV